MRREHRGALYADLVRVRGEIARDFAEHAKAASAGFGRWSDMHYLLKDLQPPVVHHVTENASRTGNSTHVIGVHTTRSAGPARGEVEGMLGYLASLAPTEEGATDAA